MKSAFGDEQLERASVEEAPMLAPQTGSLSRCQRDCKAAMAQCARVYRNFGIGMTVVAQRASAISKDVLTQCGTVFAMISLGLGELVVQKVQVEGPTSRSFPTVRLQFSPSR